MRTPNKVPLIVGKSDVFRPPSKDRLKKGPEQAGGQPMKALHP